MMGYEVGDLRNKEISVLNRPWGGLAAEMK